MICPKCKGKWFNNNHKCTTCFEGKIPEETLEFIRERMKEHDDYFLCQYTHKLLPNETGITMNFKLRKENLHIYGMQCSVPIDSLPNNTVELIDEMLLNYNQGDYLIED